MWAAVEENEASVEDGGADVEECGVTAVREDGATVESGRAVEVGWPAAP